MEEPQARPLTDPATFALYAEALTVSRKLAHRHYGRWTTQDREDLVSEVMAKFTKKWGRDGQPDAIGPWLKTVMRTTAIDLHARQQPMKEVQTAAERVVRLLDADLETPSLAVFDEEFKRAAFALVSDTDARVLELRYISNLKTAEIARLLDKSPATVTKALQNAKKRLAAELARPENQHVLDALRSTHPRQYAVHPKPRRHQLYRE